MRHPPSTLVEGKVDRCLILTSAKGEDGLDINHCRQKLNLTGSVADTEQCVEVLRFLKSELDITRDMAKNVIYEGIVKKALSMGLRLMDGTLVTYRGDLRKWWNEQFSPKKAEQMFTMTIKQYYNGNGEPSSCRARAFERDYLTDRLLKYNDEIKGRTNMGSTGELSGGWPQKIFSNQLGQVMKTIQGNCAWRVGKNAPRFNSKTEQELKKLETYSEVYRNKRNKRQAFIDYDPFFHVRYGRLTVGSQLDIPAVALHFAPCSPAGAAAIQAKGSATQTKDASAIGSNQAPSLAHLLQEEKKKVAILKRQLREKEQQSRKDMETVMHASAPAAEKKVDEETRDKMALEVLKQPKRKLASTTSKRKVKLLLLLLFEC